MFFSTYIQKLHDTIKVPKSRGMFTEKILRMIVTDQDLFNSYNAFIRSCENFYDGKTEGKGQNKRLIGDTIHRFATSVKGYLGTERLTSYFSELQLSANAKYDLCEYFKSEVPDINVDNCPEKLSQLLIQIISDAAVDGGNTHKASDPSKPVADSKADCVTVNCKVIQRVIEILEDISALYGKLDKIALEQYGRLKSKMDEARFPLELFGEFQADEKAQNEHEQMKLREEFDTKNANLELYQESVPEVKSEIEEIVAISKCLRFRYVPYYLNGYETVGCEYVSAKGEHEASGYKDRLQELMRKLTEMENDS